MRILVLGASGLLGSRLVPHLRDSGHDVRAVSRGGRGGSRIDLREPGALREAFEKADPQAVVNLAALADVDACEREPGLARAMNAQLPGAAARLGRQARIPFVHISTDMVYDGPGPHPERDARPCNVYASTKLEGDLLVAAEGGCALRTNFFGRSLHPVRKSFSDWLIGGFREGRELPLLDDVDFSPLGMETLFRLVELVLSDPPAGEVLNLGSRGGCSKREFALRLAHACGLDELRERPVSLASLGHVARRPRDMRLDVSRFEARFCTMLPDLQSEIHLVAEEYA